MTDSTSALHFSTAKRVNSAAPAPDDLRPLLPGIPNHIAQLCLYRLPPSLLSAVCRSWRRLIYSPSFPPFLSLYALTLSPPSNSLNFYSFDPIAGQWRKIIPPRPPARRRFLFRHPSFISRKLPIQSVTVSGSLVIVAATDHEFLPALSEPLIFDPTGNDWFAGPPIDTPRRWCAAGACGGNVYVASGIGAHYNNDVARSVEMWNLGSDPDRWIWEKMRNLKDGKFSREAIEAVGWRGKLCIVNVKGHAAKEGIVYDVAGDEWAEMPPGMMAGWRGPAAAMEEETIYAVDEAKGVLKKYDHERDVWVVVMEDRVLKGAQQMAAGGGKVCVVCGDGAAIAVVDVAAPPRLWVVNPPEELQVVAVHILPRLGEY